MGLRRCAHLNAMEDIRSTDWRTRTQGWKAVGALADSGSLPAGCLRELRRPLAESLVEERSSLMGAAYSALLAIARKGTAGTSPLLNALCAVLVETTGRGNSFISRTASEALCELCVLSAGDERLITKVASSGTKRERNHKIRLAVANALLQVAQAWPSEALQRGDTIIVVGTALDAASSDKHSAVRKCARKGSNVLERRLEGGGPTTSSPPPLARAAVRRASQLAASRRHDVPPAPPRAARAAAAKPHNARKAALGRELVRRASLDVSPRPRGGGARLGAAHIARALAATTSPLRGAIASAAARPPSPPRNAADDAALSSELARTLVALPPSLGAVLRAEVRGAIRNANASYDEYRRTIR